MADHLPVFHHTVLAYFFPTSWSGRTSTKYQHPHHGHGGGCALSYGCDGCCGPSAAVLVSGHFLVAQQGLCRAPRWRRWGLVLDGWQSCWSAEAASLAKVWAGQGFASFLPSHPGSWWPWRQGGTLLCPPSPSAVCVQPRPLLWVISHEMTFKYKDMCLLLSFLSDLPKWQAAWSLPVADWAGNGSCLG